MGIVSIVYRTSNNDFEKAYNEVKNKFQNYIFHKQGNHPEIDFKLLTMKSTFESPNDYVMFAVDDIIIKDFVDLSQCIDALQETKAYGFYLRLGKNITECQVLNIKTPVPKFYYFKENIYSYKFSDGQGDWGYPNTVDMTIYKKNNIKKAFEKIPYFYNPTYLEGWWASFADLNQYGLFFEESKIVNIPLNIVTKHANNKNMNISILELLNKFNKSLKIDITKFYKIANNAPHMEYTTEFIKRD